MEWALIALAQAGFSMYQQDQTLAAASKAQREGRRQTLENESELERQKLQRMRGVGSSVLGGSPSSLARQASQQGSILSSSGTGTSTGTLLGNTL